MRFRKRPVVIEAERFNGTIESARAIRVFCNQELDAPSLDGNENGMHSLIIPTLEGPMTASPGDWIIRGVNGEFYPCKPDIFEKTYESVD